MFSPSQVMFLLLLGTFAYFFSHRVRHLRRALRMGRPSAEQAPLGFRLKNMLLVAFAQRRMFSRPVPAFFHLLIYMGFFLINLEVLEIVLDGILGTHRLFAQGLGALYALMISLFEGLALGVLLACLVFLWRRNVQKVPRLYHKDLQGWPRVDGNVILLAEIVLMGAILKLGATDQLLQQRLPETYPPVGSFFFSAYLLPLLDNLSTPMLLVLERVYWWTHIVGILGFALYITYSKHLHIFMAFLHTYSIGKTSSGYIPNINAVTREVKAMLGTAEPAASSSPPPARFGAKDVEDLGARDLLGAYACTECGRCTAACPAHLTGKRLSPRKIMMAVRDSVEEKLRLRKKPAQHPKTLLGDYISHEEINACTTCQACTHACPIQIDPLSVIMQLRQYVVMEETTQVPLWNQMFASMETHAAPWKFSPTERMRWAEALHKKTEE